MKGELRSLSLSLIAAVLGAAACGGQSKAARDEPDASSLPDAGDTSLSCDLPATPCGGDLVGTWNVLSCPLELTGALDAFEANLGCRYAETISGGLEVSGSWTADASGLFWDRTVTKGTHDFWLPASCMDGFLATDCESISRLVLSLGYATAECADEPIEGGCICAGTFDQRGGLGMISRSPFQMGRYYVTGSRLSLDIEAFGTLYDYCVTGDGLIVTLPVASKVGEVVGSIVLQRQ